MNLLALCGCLKNDLQSGSSASSAVIGNVVTSSKAEYRVFFENNLGQEVFVASLGSQNNTLAIPASITSGEYGLRQDASTPQPLNLWLRVYESRESDFYFESPILFSSIEVNSSATALSWFLQYCITGNPKVSRNSWEEALRAIELDSSKNRDKTASSILNWLRGDTSVQQRILSRIQKDNPNLSLGISWNLPSYIVAYSDPVLNGTSSAPYVWPEDQTLSIRLIFIDPNASTTPIYPDSWNHIKNGSSLSTSTEKIWTYKFDFYSAGEHVIRADKETDSFDFNISVSDVNQLPVWTVPSPLVFRANKLGSYDLNSYAVDPDLTQLSYGFAGTVPVGMLIDTISGVIRWAPKQSPDTPNQVGESFVGVSAVDQQSGAKAQLLPLLVEADNLPTVTSVTNVWNVSEGIESVLEINTEDLDLDPVTVLTVPSVTVLADDPLGAGWLIKPIEVTGTPGSETVKIYYTPSYRQGLQQDQSFDLVIRVLYDQLRDPNLQLLSTPNEYVVRVNVTNMDDPPEWSLQPEPMTLVEDTLFTSDPPGGPNTSGVATDAGPNQTAVTYKWDSGYGETSENCKWGTYVDDNTPFIRIDPTTGVITGRPTLTSDRECTFRFLAEDATGLVTYSSPVVYTTTDVNRVPIVRPDAVTTFNGEESLLLTIDMLQVFDDPDASDSPADPTENLQFECLNCAGYSITPSFSGLNMVWTPGPTDGTNGPNAGTYDLNIRVTDKAGATAQTTIRINIAESLAPPIIDVSQANVIVNENGTASFKFTVKPYSNDAIDNYNFTYFVTCSYNCKSTFYNVSPDGQPTMTGSNKEFTVMLSPDFTDGDGGSGFLNYTITLQANAASNSLIFSRASATVRVNNVNRPPTAIGLGPGVPSYGSDTYSIIVSTQGDTKTSNGWIKKHIYNLGTQDPDAPNETFTYSWVTNSSDPSVSRGTPPGSFINTDNGQQWVFSYPACVSSGAPSQFVERYFMLKVSDSQNQSVTRKVRLRITNAVAQPSPLCM